MNPAGRWAVLTLFAAAVACSRVDRATREGISPPAELTREVEGLARANPTLWSRLVAARGGFVAKGKSYASSDAARSVHITVEGNVVSVAGESPASNLVLSPVRGGNVSYEAENGLLVASDVSPDVDEVLATNGSEFESFLLLKTPRAASEHAWRVEWGPEVTSAVTSEDGGLRFHDRVGRARFSMLPPFALDSRGVRRDATLRWDPSAATVRVRVDTSGLSFPVLLDPTITSISWRKVEDPESRSGSAVSYDSGRRRTVVFGGYSATNGVLSDTWEWDGGLWRRRLSASSPPGRQGAAAAYDKVHGRVLVSGGATSSVSALDDLWEWNGSNWKESQAALRPPARSRHALAFDVNRQRAVLFGGKSPSGLELGDVWEWDGSVWTQRVVVPSPGPRYGHSLAYDEQRNVTVLVGGVLAGGLSASDIWEWNGVTWTLVPVAPSAYQGGPQLEASYDPSAKVIRLANTVGGSATWNGIDLVAGAGVPPGTTSFAFDRDRTTEIAIASGVTWENSGAAWKIRTGTAAPSARLHASAAFDPLRGVVVMHGGNTVGDLPGPGTTLEWDGSRWTSLSSPDRPDPFPFQPVLAFGGPLHHVLSSHLETWDWDGILWKRLPGVPIAPLQGRTLVHDTLRQRLVLFGGTPGPGPIPPPNTWELDALAGAANWLAVTPLASPTARFGAGGAYDPLRQRVVIFGGQTNLGLSGETWEYDGLTWTQIVTPTAPSPRLYPSLLFDAARGKVALYGGTDANDLWEYDGVTWTLRSVSGPAPPHQSPLMAFDGSRYVVFGGSPSGAPDVLMSTWILEEGYGACGTNSDCPNGLFCTDAVCCASPACGACETCNGSAPGICTAVLSGPDPDSCTGSKLCDAKGACRLSLATACTTGEECSTGYCVSGICCESACTQSTSTCNPNGRCRSKLGSTCTKPTDCASEFCADGVCCESSCRGNFQTCDATGTCRGGVGAVCLSSINCTSGFCVDGVCCDSACDGLCLACKASMKESNVGDGECGPAKSGSDARNQCTATEPTSCGADGTCDGRGACRSYVKGTQCGPDVQCVTEGAATGQLCDGFGVCGKKDSSIDCAGYRCSIGKGCQTGCLSDAECISTYRCDNQRCVPKEGASCDGDHTVKSPNGTSTDCTPYKCDGASCKVKCASIYECASGFECTADGKCVIVDYDRVSDSDGCSCRATRGARYPTGGVLVAAMIASCGAWRRRKAVSE